MVNENQKDVKNNFDIIRKHIDGFFNMFKTGYSAEEATKDLDNIFVSLDNRMEIIGKNHIDKYFVEETKNYSYHTKMVYDEVKRSASALRGKIDICFNIMQDREETIERLEKIVHGFAEALEIPKFDR